MYRFLLATCLLATPALSQAEMTQQTCDLGWTALTSAIPTAENDDEPLREMSDDGWCNWTVPETEKNTDKARFIRWQAEGLEATDTGASFPTTLVLEAGREAGRPPVKDVPLEAITATLIRDPDNSTLSVPNFTGDFGALGAIMGSIEISGVNLNNIGTAQMSLGTGRVHKLAAEITSTGIVDLALKNMEGTANSAERTKALAEFVERVAPMIESLPDGFTDQAGKDSLIAFANALPDAKGVLTFDLRSDRGVGAPQFFAAVGRMADQGDPTPETIKQMLNVMLDGVVADFSWSPS